MRDTDPELCSKLDEQMAQFGQGWISSTELLGNDDLKSAQELAVLLDLSPWNVRDWSRRHPDQIPKHKRGGRVLYRVGDVQAYRARL